MAGRLWGRGRGGGGGLSFAPGDRPSRVLLVFIDGVGLGLDDRSLNPVAAASLPHIRGLLGGVGLTLSAVDAIPFRGSIGGLAAIDASLGVEGLPQSGTGQTALLTGINAAHRLGRHFGPWVHTQLRPLLARESLFRAAAERGYSVEFANAYPVGGREREVGGGRRPGAFPYAAGAAGLLAHDEASVRKGEALVSSIHTRRWQQFVDPEAPDMDPFEAGALLSARAAAAHDLTIFAHYDTDYIGHRGDFQQAVRAIELVDAFLGGIVAARSPDTLVLVTSDHGNLEAAGQGHTRNPVPLLVVGPGHRSVLRKVRSIVDVAPLVLSLLGAGATGEPDRGPLRREDPI